MDFHELEAFAALAKSLHFAKAAASLNVSPSALSRMVTRLEEELGASLMERDTRSVTLTPQGAAFLEFAEASLSQRETLRQHLAASAGQFSGTLRVYASVTACYSILPPFVKALGERYPLMKPSVDTGDPAEAAGALHAGKADMVLAAIPPEGFGRDECFLVRRSPLVFVSGKDGPYGNLGAIENTLQDYPLILPPKGLARDRFDRWAKTRRRNPPIVAEAAGNEAILALARLGLGLGLVPLIVLDNSPFADGLRHYEAGEDFGFYDIGFVLPASGARTQLRVALKELLTEVYPDGHWLEGGA
jgi:LysR family positive regulator for ilvC